MKNENIKLVFRHPVYFLAFGFGSGLLPKAPGTWGSLVGVLLYLLIAKQTLLLYSLITLIAFLFGIYLCDVTGKKLKVHDHPGIVWDEIVGFFITMLAVPFHFYTVLLGFCLFRFFDILKPWPINFLDKKIRGGLGVMLDDILAGVYANLCLQVIIIAFL